MNLIWQYHGPRGVGIAEHYAKHLREFIVRENLDGATVVVDEAQVTMTVAADKAELVARALKPHRVEDAS